MADPGNRDRLLTIPQRLVDEIRGASVSQRYEGAPLCADHAEDQYKTECMKCDLLAYMQKRRAEAAEWGFKQGERDMLAKCIAAVSELTDKGDTVRPGDVLHALRRLSYDPEFPTQNPNIGEEYPDNAGLSSYPDDADESPLPDVEHLLEIAQVGEGWHGLVMETHRRLLRLDPGYTVAQIKEKFGGLRYYFNLSEEKCYDSLTADIMYDVAYAAETRSTRICDVCGAYGKPRPGPWVVTRCDRHSPDSAAMYLDLESPEARSMARVAADADIDRSLFGISQHNAYSTSDMSTNADIDPLVSERRHQLENSDEVLTFVHAEDACVGDSCTIHRMSDHSMRSFPQHWRADRGIMERICPHGIGHPDPDDYRVNQYEYERVHGCDGCCQ